MSDLISESVTQTNEGFSAQHMQTNVNTVQEIRRKEEDARRHSSSQGPPDLANGNGLGTYGSGSSYAPDASFQTSSGIFPGNATPGQYPCPFPLLTHPAEDPNKRTWRLPTIAVQ